MSHVKRMILQRKYLNIPVDTLQALLDLFVSRSWKKITFMAPAPAPVIIQKKHFHNQQIFQNMITDSGFF